MSPISTGLATGVVVIGGNWAQGKGLGLDKLAAALFYTVMLVGLSAVNENFASQVALLVLVAAMIAYTIPIVKGLGLAK